MHLGTFWKLKSIKNPFKRLELRLNDFISCSEEDAIRDRKAIRELESRLYFLEKYLDIEYTEKYEKKREGKIA